MFLQVADALRADREDGIAYIQEEFLLKNIQLPSAYTRRIDDLAADAEDLVLDLLSRGDE